MAYYYGNRFGSYDSDSSDDENSFGYLPSTVSPMGYGYNRGFNFGDDSDDSDYEFGYGAVDSDSDSDSENEFGKKRRRRGRTSRQRKHQKKFGSKMKTLGRRWRRMSTTQQRKAGGWRRFVKREMRK